MSYLKSARKMEKHTQTEAARRLGMSRSHLSRLEQGKALATGAQAVAIRELYGVPVLEVDHKYKSSKLRRDYGIRPYALDRVNPDPWRTAYEYWGKALRALDLRIFEWLSHYLPSESTHEAYSLRPPSGSRPDGSATGCSGAPGSHLQGRGRSGFHLVRSSQFARRRQQRVSTGLSDVLSQRE